MPRTVIVEVERLREHPLYKKVIRVRRRFASHDAGGDVKAGDLVRIQESRPFSATKRWQVVEVLSRVGEAYAAAPEAADIERALEKTEGVEELLSKPERELADASSEGSPVAQPEENADAADGSRARATGAKTKA
ncbi:MAG: 30S ribosomal protein S17 [Chloroflexota bacterium]|nr:30S ribosomal protein S17 [Chloroflexota bacterium]